MQTTQERGQDGPRTDHSGAFPAPIRDGDVLEVTSGITTWVRLASGGSILAKKMPIGRTPCRRDSRPLLPGLFCALDWRGNGP